MPCRGGLDRRSALRVRAGGVVGRRCGVMRLVPETRTGRIAFYRSRIGVWAASAGEIGLTPGAVDRLAGLLADAEAARLANAQAKQAARAAASTYREAVEALHGSPGAGADMIAAIRNHAETTDDPAVYSLARIAGPKTPRRPGSAPPPGKPTRFEAELLPGGAVRLRWVCRNPRGTQGTIYLVQRQLLPGGAVETLGTTGRKRFTDDTLPRGGGESGEVVYCVTAMRSTRRGAMGKFFVKLGGRSAASAGARSGGGSARAA